MTASQDRFPAEADALLDALLAARTAGGWVPLPWLVVICEPPLVLRTEVTAGPEQRLHCAMTRDGTGGGLAGRH